MDNLFLQIGHSSVNKKNELLCGDFYTIVKNLDTTTIVLSDGLGSGVKANILATLTSKILSTLLSKNLPIEESVYTIARTLPICKDRKLAYATFSAIQIKGSHAYLIQYDNPEIIILRNGKNLPYRSTRTFIEEKEIYESNVQIQKDDMIILFSDGVTYAGLGKTNNNGWNRNDILKHLENWYTDSTSAQRMAANLINGCMALNMDSAEDDTTVLVFKVRERQAVNILIGPPENKEDDNKVLRLFFSKEGKYVVCGGTTASAVSHYLNKPINLISNPETDEDIPSIASIEGVDLVTEGVITLGKVVHLSNEYLKDSSVSLKIKDKTDGASLLAEILFEEATDINIFFGQAMNKGHEDVGLDIDFKTKCELIKTLESNLIKMGKQVKISRC